MKNNRKMREKGNSNNAPILHIYLKAIDIIGPMQF